MTRQEFVELHRHQIAGLVLDAATAGRQGAELSVWLKLAMGKIDAQLGKMWEGIAANDTKPMPAKAEAQHNGLRVVSPAAKQAT